VGDTEGARVGMSVGADAVGVAVGVGVGFLVGETVGAAMTVTKNWVDATKPFISALTSMIVVPGEIARSPMVLLFKSSVTIFTSREDVIYFRVPTAVVKAVLISTYVYPVPIIIVLLLYGFTNFGLDRHQVSCGSRPKPSSHKDA